MIQVHVRAIARRSNAHSDTASCCRVFLACGMLGRLHEGRNTTLRHGRTANGVRGTVSPDRPLLRQRRGKLGF